MTTKQRVIVTGGAGFLGSHLCERLLVDGYDVLCVDNFFTGTKGNVTHLQDHPYFELLRHDVNMPLYVEVDIVFNLACAASPIQYQKRPVETIKTSVVGATNMLGLAKRCGAVFVQASTSEIYGDPEVHPQTEDYVGHVDPLGPRACYDEGKRCAETLCSDYRREYGVNSKIMRIFNTYGPRMKEDDGRVISNFILQALSGEDVTIYGDGSQTRSFCYVDDLIEAFMAMLNTDADFAGPVNIGNPNEITIRETAEKIIAMTGSKSKLVFEDLPVDDPKRRQPDISLAKKSLGWQPEVDLETGLAKTIEYFAGSQ